MNNENHQKQLKALKEKSYESIAIHRLKNDCYLIVDIEGTSHVFEKDDGTAKKYRHVWQVKGWLRDAFEIDSDAIPVKVLNN